MPIPAVVGSTDLTHHGPRYGHVVARGKAGADWTEKNDRRMIALMEALAADKVIAESKKHRNACGAGAVAATLAACRVLGATKGRCLAYTNSYKVIRRLQPNARDDNTVGYASVVLA